MAEAIGAAIGVVGVLGQLFDGCVKAYRFFSAAAHRDSEGQRLICKVRIEEMRLVVWGREWGVSEGRLEEHLARGGDPRMRELATSIMGSLYECVTDARRLKDKYGLIEGEEDGGVQKGGKGKSGNGNGNKGKKNGSGAQAETLGSSSSSSTSLNLLTAKLEIGKAWGKDFSLRAQWVIADKEKFGNLLQDLKDFNDGLERLFPASRLPTIHRSWAHQLLESAQRDTSQLALLETASSGTYNYLTTSANLKKLRINLDTQDQSAFSPTFALRVDVSSLTLTTQGIIPARESATHNVEGAVVVEWVDYDGTSIDERFVHLRRIDDLARMLRSASHRHPDLHTLDCLGYTNDTTHHRFGLIYRAPKTGPFPSLHDLIASNDLRTPDLDDRVRLAHTLAVALWSLHSLDWLHKSLCSNNILFFPDPPSSEPKTKPTFTPNISNPHLVGFDASRPTLDTSLSIAPRNPSISDLHRHPDSIPHGLSQPVPDPSSQSPFRKSYDIYSLGIVLLEIGLWKTLQTYHKPHYSPERWRDRVILPVLVPGLGSKVGKRYRDVVETCLRVGGDVGGMEVGLLLEGVVNSLESIRV